jgi:cobalt/nickel transport system permease protein
MRAIPLGVYGSLTGHLLVRSLDRAERVHRSMSLRGFDGRIRTGTPSRISRSDLAFAALWLVFLIVARAVNVADALGGYLLGAS